MYFHCHIMILCLYTAAYSEPCQTPETELLTKVSKRSSLDASKASEYVFVIVQIAQFEFLNIHQILQNVKYQQTKKLLPSKWLELFIRCGSAYLVVFI